MKSYENWYTTNINDFTIFYIIQTFQYFILMTEKKIIRFHHRILKDRTFKEKIAEKKKKKKKNDIYSFPINFCNNVSIIFTSSITHT